MAGRLLYLVRDGLFDAQLFTLLITLSMAAGAVTAFSPYLPAFLAFFLAATLPFMAVSFFLSDPLLRHLVPPLMPIFIVGMGGLGVRANQAFAQLISLQIQTEELAEDLARQKDIAEQANRAKSAFLAAASHDLRQPVHALGLFVGALSEIPVPPEARRLVEQIAASAEAMDDLFNALLDISRLDAGVVEVERRPFRIGQTIARVCRDYAPEAEAKGVRLKWFETPGTVDSDPVLIERILRNLISNAVRYTDRGKILVGCRRRGSRIVFQVWDTGRGIPPEQQAHVFQEYYQLHNPERDRSKGLGLGLAIVRRLSGLLGCELTLRSQLGRGSCFALAVPAATHSSASEPSEPAGYGSRASGQFVVVVDDELAIREGMSALLARWGYRVVGAGSGDEAIERLADSITRPALIICDYRLRGEENGVAVIERLRSEFNETIPAMLITGDTAPARLAEADARDVLLLHKPVSNSKLRSAVLHLIATPTESGEESAAAK